VTEVASNKAHFSQDGISWFEKDFGAYTPGQMAFGNGKFLVAANEYNAVANTDTAAFLSCGADPTGTWTYFAQPVGAPSTFPRCTACLFKDGYFFLMGKNTAGLSFVASSPDTITWIGDVGDTSAPSANVGVRANYNPGKVHFEEAVSGFNYTRATNYTDSLGFVVGQESSSLSVVRSPNLKAYAVAPEANDAIQVTDDSLATVWGRRVLDNLTISELSVPYVKVNGEYSLGVAAAADKVLLTTTLGYCESLTSDISNFTQPADGVSFTNHAISMFRNAFFILNQSTGELRKRIYS